MWLIQKIRERFCKHNFKKYWDKELGVYVPRCTKCGKVIYKAWRKW